MHGQLFTLPTNTLVYPARNYKGATVSSIGEKRPLNLAACCLFQT